MWIIGNLTACLFVKFLLGNIAVNRCDVFEILKICEYFSAQGVTLFCCTVGRGDFIEQSLHPILTPQKNCFGFANTKKNVFVR